ncbi:MAG TPA: amidase [Thermomicrobiales bacterium]|nr:amidase [Thermomicrobiales bacterium]
MDLHDAPLAATAAALRSGERDLPAYIEEVCDRVDALEPELRALLPEPDRRARLRNAAAALARRYPDPAGRPPLYGVPVGVKDIFRVEGFPTRAGSQLPPELFAGPEAAVVTALKGAGALILGKTVTTEFAASEPGPTRNPHNPAHTPGGSSSGSAAAVAAGYCPLALGSQTIGSVIRPAAFCGVLGYKPTYGRVPLEGVLPYSPSVDHVGCFTQDAAGLRLAAALLVPDWRAGDDTGAGRPVLGIPEGPYLDRATPEGLAALAAQARRLADAGYTVRRVAAFADFAAIERRHRRLSSAEFAAVHADWFAAHEALYRPRSAALVRDGREVGDEELATARAGRAALRDALAAAMGAAGIDLWICPPATGPAPAGLDATGDPIMNLPWTHAGVPVVTLPAGHAENGLPLGLQCAARAGADERLLAWAGPLAAALKPD